MVSVETLEQKINRLRDRSGNIRFRELESIAISVGRKRGKRGKEPTFIDPSGKSKPLSIPNHSRSLSRITANNVLNVLEEDLVRLQDADDGR